MYGLPYIFGSISTVLFYIGWRGMVLKYEFLNTLDSRSYFEKSWGQSQRDQLARSRVVHIGPLETQRYQPTAHCPVTAELPTRLLQLHWPVPPRPARTLTSRPHRTTPNPPTPALYNWNPWQLGETTPYVQARSVWLGSILCPRPWCDRLRGPLDALSTHPTIACVLQPRGEV